VIKSKHAKMILSMCFYQKAPSLAKDGGFSFVMLKHFLLTGNDKSIGDYLIPKWLA
jgi:hypothetical protein